MTVANGKYYKVGEHNILVPEPEKKSDILFINENKDNAFWQRDILIKEYRQVWLDFIPNFTKMWQNATIYDQDGMLVSLNEDDSKYVDRIWLQERHRRVHGVHFKNKDTIQWITGDHYFFLMHARMQRHDGMGQYADYRKFQSDYAYIIHHARTNPHILGAFVSKPKKTGITNFHWSGVYLNKATLYKNKNLGYMNINQQQAAKTFNDYFMYSYNGLTSPLKPEFRNKSLVEGTITFARSYSSSKKAVRPNNSDEDDDLNTSVFCVPTKNKAFDVAVMSDITMDEPTKYKENFAEIWRTNKEAVKIQSKFNGRAWLFNYTPEENSESFKEARTIFFDSELKTITPFSDGQTKEGLICYHIPAYGAWEGAFDKYGECDEEKAIKEIQRERDKVKGNRNALQAITRQYANDKREAWGAGGLTSIFDPVRLTELEMDLEEEQRSGQTFEEGELQWVNPLWEVGKKDKRPAGTFDLVKFIPLTREQKEKGAEGKMRMYEKLAPRIANRCLLHGKDEFSNLMPPERFIFCAGIDPADFRDSGNAEEGSLIGMYAMAIHDELTNTANRKVTTKIIYAEYHSRPDNPEEWYQDIVKFIIYYGAIVIIEANNGTIATRLEAEGLGHYMLFKNSDGIISKYKANHKGTLKHIKNVKAGNVDIIADLILYIKNYLLEGNEEYGEIDYGKTIKSEKLLAQLKDFDPDDTKKSDLVMAFGYTLMCHYNYLVLLNQPVDRLYQSHYIRTAFNAVMNVYG